MFVKVGKNEFLDPYKEGHPFYADKKFKEVSFGDGHINFVGLHRYDDKRSHFENEKFFIAVIGEVYYKYQYAGSNEYNLSAEELFIEFKENPEWLNKVKGNFTIFIYDKDRKHLKVVNDQFALRPMYYTRLNGEVIISNNLNNFKSFSKSINEVVLLEQILFNYSLDNQTILTGVKYLDAGQIMDIRESKIDLSKYFRLSEIVFHGENEKFNIGKFQQLFNFSVLQKTGNKAPALTTLTGGLDGRSIVSTLMKEKRAFSSYSFGKKGGENTSIPLNISQKLNFKHKAIYLENDFEKEYAKYALEAIYFSDGLSLFEKSIFPFVMNQLSTISTKTLSGAIGGELLRPITEPHSFINNAYYDIIFKGNDIDFFTYFEEMGLLDYIEMAVIDNNKQELFERVNLKRKEMRGKKKEENGYLYALYDFIRLGFRRYYGSELHMERFYTENLLPFFDYDVLHYLLRSDYRTIHKDTFKKNIRKQWKSHRTYAQLFQLNCPELGKIEVDRGFFPEHVLHPLKQWNIPFKIRKNKEVKKEAPPEITSDVWSDILYKRLLEMDLKTSNLFNIEAIRTKMKEGSVEGYNQSFNHLLGIYTWIHLV